MGQMGQKIEERLVNKKKVGKIKAREESKEMENKLKEVERMLERKKKENKKRNIIIKGVGVKEKTGERQ